MRGENPPLGINGEGRVMPLTADQLECLSRGGTCMACHQDIPDGSIPMKMLGQVAKVANLSFAPADELAHLLRENNILIAWIKVFAIIGGIIAVPAAIVCILKRKKIMARFRNRAVSRKRRCFAHLLRLKYGF